MIDPLTISATVLALSRTVVLSVRELASLRHRLNSCPTIINSITTESTIINIVLVQLKSLLSNAPQDITARIERSPDLGDVLEIALKNCAEIYSLLMADISHFKENPKKPGRLRTRDRIRFLWNEDNLKELLQQLRSHQNALTSLLQCFQAADVMEIKHGVSLLLRNLDSEPKCDLDAAESSNTTPTAGKDLDEKASPENSSNGRPQLDISANGNLEHKPALPSEAMVPKLLDFALDPEIPHGGDLAPSYSPSPSSLDHERPSTLGDKSLGKTKAGITFLIEDASAKPSASISTGARSRTSQVVSQRRRRHGQSTLLILEPDLVASLLE
ncbi:hypothetical protein BCR34DRAFT_557528 [Clohesyomyces aquaticus]|uniref:Fungal N-terminal domain-containing protein n=1 Tax=Clohesyomyces aquaticus TaxID=1231657 RepID=A0A1Y2A164_9PLEO|nr:hypothetical protein BCR34DRAFT_557528 [Clohesyomyces aquaticus]